MKLIICNGRVLDFGGELQMEVKEISQAVIGRLPRYYRYLSELDRNGKTRISSTFFIVVNLCAIINTV